jgi:hypothetical protein
MTQSNTAGSSSHNPSVADTKRQQAQTLIDAMSKPVLQHVIAGRSCPSLGGEVFSNFSPFDGSLLNVTAAGTAADVHAASLAASAPQRAARTARCTARLRRARGMQVDDHYPQLANIRRVLMASCAPAMMEREGGKAYLHAALEVLERFLPQVVREFDL